MQDLLHWISQMPLRMSKIGSVELDTRCGAKDLWRIWREHREDVIRIIADCFRHDELLTELVRDAELSKSEAAIAAITDYMEDLMPSPRLRMGKKSCANWLRLRCFQNHRIRQYAKFMSRTASTAVNSLHAILGENPDHYGSAVVRGHEVFVSDPYRPVEVVRAQASSIRDELRLVAVGTSQGAWAPGTSRLTVFKPLA